MIDPEILVALIEWRDARQAIFDRTNTHVLPDTQALWSRLSKAEHNLMRLARNLTSEAANWTEGASV